MISENVIIDVARRYARRVHQPSFEDLAVYLLVVDGHYKMADVCRRMGLADRSDALAAVNRVSVAYMSRGASNVRDTVDKARNAIRVNG